LSIVFYSLIVFEKGSALHRQFNEILLCLPPSAKEKIGFCFSKQANFSSLRTAKSANKNSQLISKNLLISSQICPPKRGAKPRARRLIQYGGVCWTMSELSLSKIRTLTDAKLLRNFANGSRQKFSSP